MFVYIARHAPLAQLDRVFPFEGDSERFYRLLSQVMPNWEITKERLDGLVSRVLAL